MMLVIDYGMGNVASVVNMFARINHPVELGHTEEMLARADKLVLSGVGSFDAGRARLRVRDLDTLLACEMLVHRKPLLGICLGLQMLMERSDEGQATGLGFLRGEVRAIRRVTPELRVPHMGWAPVSIVRPHWLFPSEPPPRYYFVHSYHVRCADPGQVFATVEHGETLCAAAGHENIVGVQLHPEKSHRFGMDLLVRFAGHA